MTGLGMSGHVFNYAEASFQDVPINEATVISRLNPRSVTAGLCLLGGLQNKFSGSLKSISFMVSEVHVHVADIFFASVEKQKAISFNKSLHVFPTFCVNLLFTC
jgi:hypothetical protein